MDALNYHHLRYFWVVARDGGVTAASRSLGLAPSTISAQIHRFEEQLGYSLFRRKGRSLVLTDIGQTVYEYAEEIFALGRELRQTVDEQPLRRASKLVIGVADVLPRLLVVRMLRDLSTTGDKLRLVCRTGDPERLIAEMVLHRVHVVFSDAPALADVGARVESHLVGTCGIALFATPELAARHRTPMPRALDGAPFLLPAGHTEMRRALERWFVDRGVRPHVVGEFDDSALMKVFGQSGRGIFPGPALVAREIAEDFGVVPIGRLDGPEERVYAHTLERRTAHPLVAQLIADAQAVFNGRGSAL